ncbi:hypothetical protein GCM10010172_53850 [Paractinoplanes ferrugineus]|uniref:Uncharacterized protein n=1 Tax=Paractinoplanes ferrugineus TaxID=113564 RepID=A0A919J1S4_9ACTN|nr:hypothetical protein Afe05nite_36370 [Actinoplanes ferrugineus]
MVASLLKSRSNPSSGVGPICPLVRGSAVLKKLLIVAGIVGAAALVVKKVKASSDERALWHEATTAPDLR